MMLELIKEFKEIDDSLYSALLALEANETILAKSIIRGIRKDLGFKDLITKISITTVTPSEEVEEIINNI